MFKSKNSVLSLVWSFFGFLAFQSLYTTHFNMSNLEWQVGSMTIVRLNIVGPCFFVYPVFGWLADAKFGRYKVIKWSYISLLLLSAVFCIISIFQSNSGSNYVSKFLLLWHVPMALVSGGIITNIGQLGIDQLYGASSSEIASFVLWWTWVWTLSGVFAYLGQSCFCKYPALASLLMPAAITLAVCFDLLFNSWLVKESPPPTSPFTKIYKILSYALKHRYPVGSAQIDWDESQSARLDVGKRKYGGPFSNEEVEDVKTLLRIIAVMMVGMIFASPYFPLDEVYLDIMTALDHNVLNEECDQTIACFNRLGVILCGDITILFAIPLFKVVLCPVFRLHYSLSILKRCFIGMLLGILSVMSAVFVVFTAQHRSQSLPNGTCYQEFETETSVDYRWMAIPYSLKSAVEILLLMCGAHFILAQSPYSLKGFLFGLGYGLIGLSAIIGFGLSFGLQSIIKRYLSHPYDCTFWYLILVLSVFLILAVASLISFKCYKRRQREDTHKHLFSVDYYH